MALPLKPDDPPRVGRYRVVGRLGEGGQGIVYLAETEDARQVAVKVLRANPTDGRARRRFAREVQILQRLDEECTAPILDFNLDAERPYLVSTYVSGPSLEERIGRHGPMNSVELNLLAVKTMAALRVVHEEKITHRDIKPRNILLGPGDHPRIIDFGVAKVMTASDTHTTETVATPAYMSPEQRRRELVVSSRSDIYSWALTILFAAGGYDTDSGKRDLGRVNGVLRTMLDDCLAEESAARPSADVLYQRMAAAWLARAAGMPDERTTASQMPGLRTAPDVVASPWYLDPHMPFLASGALTAVTTGLGFLILDAGPLKLIPAAVGTFVILLVLSSILTDPARHSEFRRGNGRPRKPIPRPRE